MLVKPSGSVDKTFSIVLCILCLLKKHVCTVDLFFFTICRETFTFIKTWGIFLSHHGQSCSLYLHSRVKCLSTSALFTACCTGYFYMAVEGSGTRLHGTIIEKYKCNLSHTNIMNIHLLISIAGSWNNQI